LNGQQVVGTTDSNGQTTVTMENYASLETDMNQQTTAANCHTDKFIPAACPPYSVNPGYSCVGGPFTRRGPSILPEIDLSHRPSSLQEAICMYIDFLLAENEIRTRISECAVASPAPPLDFHREEYYRDVMCRPVNFPTARFRDWLKRYNVDIEITDPDGQTVSQTTFAPAAGVTQSSDGDGETWAYTDGASPMVVQRRRQRPATTRNAVICHPPPVPHPLLHLQPDPFPVQMLGSPSAGTAPMQTPMNFTPAPSATTSTVYQSQPPPHPEPTCVPAVAGCGYAGSLPREEDNTECKEEPCSSVRPEMPVSGWPDVSLEHPESGRTTSTAVDCELNCDAEDAPSDQPLSGGSAGGDTYFQDEGSADCGDGRFRPRCFEAAADEGHHWTADADRSVTDVNQPGHLDQVSSAQLARNETPARAEMGHANAFPVVIEPESPSSGCATVGSVIQDFTKCFEGDNNNNNVGAAEYQLAYVEAGGGSEMHELSADAQLSDAAAPDAGTTTPLSRSTTNTASTSACFDLGADFADLLATQHSDEFDYHLNAHACIATGSNLPTKQMEVDDTSVLARRRSQPRGRGRSTRTRGFPKSIQRATPTGTATGPTCKAPRREPAAHF